MSYNLLSGSIEFIGAELGQIEDIVNTHSTQRVAGAKTFTNITASGGAIVTGGALQVATALQHFGDINTEVSFGTDIVTISAGGKGLIQAHGAQNKVTINNDEDAVDFKVNTGLGEHGFFIDGITSAVMVGNHDMAGLGANQNTLLHISSSNFPHSASLLSVGRKNNPVLAVSGGANVTDWRTIISGTLYTNSDIQASGIITGSLGIKGELLNVGNGLEHLSLAGQKKLSVKASSTNQYLGLGVGTEGVRLGITGLTEEGSLNTDNAQPDWVVLADNNGAGSYTNKKQKVSVLLGDTLSTVSNIGTGVGIYNTVLNRQIKLRSIVTSNKLLTATVVSDDVRIEQKPNPAINQLTSSNTMLSGSTRHEFYTTTISSNGQNVSLAARTEKYQVFTAQGNPFNATASLPQITEANLGIIYNIKFLGTGPCLITGSAGTDQVIDGSQEVIMSGGTPGSAKFKELLAVKFSGGSYEWCVVGEN